MKFALFLICALVAVQGYQARSVEVDARFNVSEILGEIRKFIETIKQFISQISAQLPQIIENLTDKVKELINRISEQVKELMQKIEDFIRKAGEIGRKCSDAHRGQIEAILEFTEEGLKECVAKAEAEIKPLKEQMEVLVNKARDLTNDVLSRGMECIEKNIFNPAKLVSCIIDQVEPIKAEIIELQKEMTNTIELAKVTIKETIAILGECVKQVEHEVQDKEVALFNSLKKCVTESA